MFDNYLAWLTAGVVGPSVLPPLANVIKRGLMDDTPLNRNVRDNLHFLSAIKDGQLCWVSVGLLITGLFEMLITAQQGMATVIYTMGLALLLFANGIVFSEGSGTPTPWPGTPILGMRRLWISVIALLATALCCFCIHYAVDMHAWWQKH
jgi:hypothetical protein